MTKIKNELIPNPEPIEIDGEIWYDAGEILMDRDDLHEIYNEDDNEIDAFDTRYNFLQKNMFIDINKIKKVAFSDEIVKTLEFGNIQNIYNLDVEEAKLEADNSWDFLKYRFRKLHEVYPDIFRFEGVKGKKFIQKLFEEMNIPDYAYHKSMSTMRGKNYILNLVFATEDENILVLYDGSDDIIFFYDHKLEKDPNSILYTWLGLVKNFKEPNVPKNKIYIVYRNQQGFTKTGFDVKKLHIDIDENYNDDFKDVSENIIKDLNNKNKTGLIILSGEPGTGKSTYIRYLTGKITRDIIFISPDMVEQITDPSFIPFLINNNNCILVIEDAEPALEKRNTRHSAVSNVLNLTDGLLSDCLNISIVATFNTKEKNIDDALLRKGRLLMNYHFDKLNPEKSTQLLKKNGYDIVTTKPMTLAEIYYHDKDNRSEEFKTRKIGF